MLIWSGIIGKRPCFRSNRHRWKRRTVRARGSRSAYFCCSQFWVSKRADREPVKRGRDLAQAQVVIRLTTQYLEHLTYEASELRALPRAVFDEAHHLFVQPASRP
ncbi:GSU2403 family nucleotidyltransferase fold protein [Mesorhizobium sp. M0968]|uniref:GSU2403 family nucleotidyltransferase fold protein n=1 Tax=Mesorhizobium sp. M0968 TaxID=2957037 RepID=UPI00333D8E1C